MHSLTSLVLKALPRRPRLSSLVKDGAGTLEDMQVAVVQVLAISPSPVVRIVSKQSVRRRKRLFEPPSPNPLETFSVWLLNGSRHFI